MARRSRTVLCSLPDGVRLRTVPSTAVSPGLWVSSCCFLPQEAPRRPPSRHTDPLAQSSSQTPPPRACYRHFLKSFAGAANAETRIAQNRREKPTNEVNTQTFLLPPCTSAHREPRKQQALHSVCCTPKWKNTTGSSQPQPPASPSVTLTRTLAGAHTYREETRSPSPGAGLAAKAPEDLVLPCTAAQGPSTGLTPAKPLLDP